MKCDNCINLNKEEFGCNKLDLLFSNGYMAESISKSCDDMSDETLNRLRMYYGVLGSKSSPFRDYKRSVVA